MFSTNTFFSQPVSMSAPFFLTEKAEPPFFHNGLYSYGALLGYLSNIENFENGNVKITALSGKAEYDKFGRETFCGEFKDRYDIHKLLLWHGSGAIHTSDHFRSFTQHHGISFSQSHSEYDPGKRSYCTGYIEDLLIIWNFIGEKRFDTSTVKIYPPKYRTEKEALDGIVSTFSGTAAPYGSEKFYEAPRHEDAIAAENISNDPEFRKGFSDGFNY